MPPIRSFLAAIAAAGALAGCQQTAERPETIVLCNDAGCSEQPAGIETFDPSAAMPDEDPEGRLPALLAAAEADPRAAYDLGIRYMRGDGIRQNSYKALQWMREAAERGDLRAQGALGRLYLTGLEEMGADYNEAQKWLAMAGARGDREAARLAVEAQEMRAEEQRYQTALRRWREVYTGPYWYRSRYYGYWGDGYRRYRYY